jgi:hypothetical protein
VSAETRERAEEIANGGLVSREGNLVTLGNGAKWWLNGKQWARNTADSLLVIDRARQAERTKQ